MIAFRDGGWILDAFPEDKDQWSAMVEAGVLPDECIVLSDKSPNLSVIRKRFVNFVSTSSIVMH